MNYINTPKITEYEKLLQLLRNYDNIIFDIGDVILEWDSVHETLSKDNGINDLKAMMKHPIWQDLEKGFIKRELAFSLLSNELSTPYDRLETLFQLSVNSLIVNQSMVGVLKALKQGGKSLICLSNIDFESFCQLNKQYDFWDLFDQTYISSLLHLNKPHQSIFEYVVKNAQLDPENTVFIDDKLENLIQAETFGISTIRFSKGQFEFRPNSHCDIENLDLASLEAKKQKGEAYLYQRLRAFPFCKSFTGDNIHLLKSDDFSKEIFSTAVILHIASELPTDIIEAMSKEMLNHSQDRLYWCFYTHAARPEDFPKDLDTTAMVLSFLLAHDKIAKHDVMSVAESMLKNRNQDGIIQVYFDDNRPRIDAIVAVNVLYLMHQLGLGDREELRETRRFVYEYLKSGSYLDGTRYYPCPDVFLFFLSRLVMSYKDAYQPFIAPLKNNLLSRVDVTPHCVERAARIMALKQLGIVNRVDFVKLLSCQLEDGGWPMYGLFIAAKTKTFFGSRELASAFALEALRTMR